MGRHHGGLERRESAERRAETIVNEELKRRGWDRNELKRRRKADPSKVQVARRLRKERTMNWQWIAASLAMGVAGYAAACVRELLKQSRGGFGKYANLRNRPVFRQLWRTILSSAARCSGVQGIPRANWRSQCA